MHTEHRQKINICNTQRILQISKEIIQEKNGQRIKLGKSQKRKFEKAQIPY